MNRWTYSVLLAVFMGTGVFGATTVEGDKEIKTYKILVLKAKTDAKDAGYIWDFTDEKKLSVKEVNGGGTIHVTGEPGEYEAKLRVVDFATKKIETARHTFTIGNGKPPDPKPPDPKPPGPESALTKALKAAYAKDMDSDKTTTLATLTALYLAWDEITADKLLVKTVGDLVKVLQNSATLAGLKPTQLVNLRKAIGEHLKSKWGDYSKGMDEATKTLVLSTLSEVAHALKEVGK